MKRCIRWRLAAKMVLLASFVLAMVCLSATAADEDVIDESVVKGVAWLADQQNPEYGCWGFPGEWDNSVGKTGFAVLKLEDFAVEQGYENAFDDEYAYKGNVEDGLNYIFSKAVLIDTDGDGTDDGLCFMYSLMYETSIAVMAIADSGTPDRIVLDNGSPVKGKTYKEVVELAVNYLVFAQQENGGWGYHHGDWWTDNSNTGYVSLGLTYAQNKFCIPIPEDTLTGMNSWVDFIQCVEAGESYGGSGYSGPCEWVNILKTGNLLYEMAMVGDTADSDRAELAVEYIQNHWDDSNWDPGWKGPGWGPEYDWPEFQTTYTMMKGFDAMGIETITVEGEEIDWFDEVTTAIVTSQNDDGSWNQCGWGDEILATEWALLTLERSVEVPLITVSVDIKPGSCPNPINLKSKGVLPVAVLGTEDFDVKTIDPATVKLCREGVEGAASPNIRWNYEDVATPFEGELCDCHDINGDGILDLTLKFSVQDVVGTLELEEVADSTILPLTITGNLNEDDGGSPIKGQDCVKVLKKGKADYLPGV